MTSEITITSTVSSVSLNTEKQNNTKQKRLAIEAMIKQNDIRVTLVESTRRTNKISPVWEHFKYIHVDGVRQEFVQCADCKVIIGFNTMNGTNGLKKHIDSCPKIMNSKSGVQSNITSHFKSFSKDSSCIPDPFIKLMTNTSAEQVALVLWIR
ncbi:unnamed protein product [Adineta ricciae]|uniref:BED-type domain-containing protein n=1 Tax=Adineta ricciae TaxID=249248 RepID=A0A815EY72_ADIRI|nr:unnamed protein product [Adineta ricciae]CAF1525029.1 unnamed protein product [Adineta ricciae]